MMKKYVFFVLILFIFYVGPSSAEANSNEAREHFIKGKKILESALSPLDFVNAEMEFEKAIELAPDWAEAYYNLALISAEIGKQVKAIRSFERYLEITKNPADKSEVLLEISKLKKIRETKRRIGLSGISIVALQDGVYLMNVLPGSKIEKAGFKTGDKIIEVNKRSTIGIKLEDFYKLIETPFEDPGLQARFSIYAKRTGIENIVGITIIRGGKQQVIPTSLDVFKSNVYEIEEDEFEDEVIRNSMPTFVVFWADWCTYCIKFTSVMEQIAEKYKGKVTVVSINIQNNKKISEKFKIQAIPTTILFKDSRQLNSVTGYKNESDIEKLLTSQNVKEDFKLKASDYKGDDIYVVYVIPNSSAYKSGIKPGDIIKKINGIDISKNAREFITLINDLPEGENIFTILRDGVEINLSVTLPPKGTKGRLGLQIRQ
ncbi:thioredoxin [Caldimicrobium thiodismutans]|uniref:Thioredoxin n=2 Tax=Caldimicrobium thiodismutans TaxID=1653476 RepID=A0A0U5AZH9_9BACT|nr:thioredoxin [Caldimicrobium thiodismutans]